MNLNMGEILEKAKSTVETGKRMIEESKKTLKINEIKKKIEEHKYNIGKLIYDNEIEVNNDFIVSNINSIDRLIEEINQLGGK